MRRNEICERFVTLHRLRQYKESVAARRGMTKFIAMELDALGWAIAELSHLHPDEAARGKEYADHLLGQNIEHQNRAARQQKESAR